MPDETTMPDETVRNDAQAVPAGQTAAEQTPEEAAEQARREDIIAALKTCYDPEIPVDIWELGLIYRVDLLDDDMLEIDMTLTSPMCPVAGELPIQVQTAVENVPWVKECKVEVVWDPPWRQDMMSEVAQIQLDMF
jgi:FeS assembly SUF system protein